MIELKNNIILENNFKKPEILLEKKKLQFKSEGVGARGLNNYAFTLDFHSELDTKESIHKITDNRVDFTLSKTAKGWWPRLTSQIQKPIWLKIDHDRFQSEDIDPEFDENLGDIREQYPDLYQQLQKDEIGYRKGNKNTCSV